MSVPQHGHRWLKAFLNLKEPQGKKIVFLLAQKAKYPVLLFDLEAPNSFRYGINVAISSQQVVNLQHWAITSQAQVSIGLLKQSKQLLNAEFAQLKPKAESRLEND